MNLKDCLFLFDIDGTILDVKGDGKSALLKAIDISCKTEITEAISLLGGIDNVFFRYYFNLSGLPEMQYADSWKTFEKEYLRIMEAYDKKNWHIYPNAYETVSYLADCSNIGLTTGNIEKGATIKLKRFNLDKFFHAGGFGDKAANRTEMVKDAINACESYYRKMFKRENIFLFGDTEKDMTSAIENSIVPVQIDPLYKNREFADKWGALYYGNFVHIENFFISISNNKNQSETIFFDK